MGYKRKSAEAIVKQNGGCEGIDCTSDTGKECVCTYVNCSFERCLEYAKKWLEEHPKKEKKPKIKAWRLYRSKGGVPIVVTGEENGRFRVKTIELGDTSYILAPEDIKEFEND